MPNPNPPLIPSKHCYRHNKTFPATDYCEECETDLELNEMLDDIRGRLLELREFIIEHPQYNGKIIYDFEIEKMIEILGAAIVNLDI